MDVPGRLEEAVVECSDIIGEENQAESESNDREDYREDSPFGTSEQSSNDETTIEDTVQWLHDQGYTFKEMYGLLIGEIQRLTEGFERKQERKEEQQSSSGGTTSETAYGNKGDRAEQLGWR